MVAQLPERENLKKSMRRHRRRNLPPNPQSVQELDQIPDRYQVTLSDETFLIYDSAAGDAPLLDREEARVLVFATRRNLELLANSEAWYLDGTFKTAPTIFTQIFTIIGEYKKF